MENESPHHIVKYRSYLLILACLIALTGISVAVTHFDMGNLAVTIALVLATIKSTLVLVYFMHLKFDDKMYTYMVLLVLAVFLVVIVITFLDYSFR